MRTYALGPQGYGVYEVTPQGEGWRRHEGTADRLLVPGFVDVHIHGGFGVDFMAANRDANRELCDRLRALGYDGILATTITASASDVSHALAALPDDPLIMGFHFEGPFISPKFPGAQPLAFIIDPPTAPGEWDAILDDPRMRYITLAPELPGARELASRLSERGVVVSMGHTNATYREAAAGFAAGFRSATHTFNAMRPLHHREAGTVGFVLTEDGLNAELIYDRHHVTREAARLLIRSKPPERLIAVSDGTLASGAAPGTEVAMWGHEGIVGQGDVRLRDGTLAGSAITLLDAFRNLYHDFGPEVAIRACCLNPRRLLGMDGPPQVWVEFDLDLNLVQIHG